MSFLPSNQQRQRTEGKNSTMFHYIVSRIIFLFQSNNLEKRILSYDENGASEIVNFISQPKIFGTISAFFALAYILIPVLNILGL